MRLAGAADTLKESNRVLREDVKDMKAAVKILQTGVEDIKSDVLGSKGYHVKGVSPGADLEYQIFETPADGIFTDQAPDILAEEMKDADTVYIRASEAMEYAKNTDSPVETQIQKLIADPDKFEGSQAACQLFVRFPIASVTRTSPQEPATIVGNKSYCTARVLPDT